MEHVKKAHPHPCLRHATIENEVLRSGATFSANASDSRCDSVREEKASLHNVFPAKMIGARYQILGSAGSFDTSMTSCPILFYRNLIRHHLIQGAYCRPRRTCAGWTLYMASGLWHIEDLLERESSFSIELLFHVPTSLPRVSPVGQYDNWCKRPWTPQER